MGMKEVLCALGVDTTAVQEGRVEVVRPVKVDLNGLDLPRDLRYGVQTTPAKVAIRCAQCPYSRIGTRLPSVQIASKPGKADTIRKCTSQLLGLSRVS